MTWSNFNLFIPFAAFKEKYWVCTKLPSEAAKLFLLTSSCNLLQLLLKCVPSVWIIPETGIFSVWVTDCKSHILLFQVSVKYQKFLHLAEAGCLLKGKALGPSEDHFSHHKHFIVVVWVSQWEALVTQRDQESCTSSLYLQEGFERRTQVGKWRGQEDTHGCYFGIDMPISYIN